MKKIIVAFLIAVATMLGAQSAEAASYVSANRSISTFADTPGFKPCSFGGSARAVGLGSIDVYANWDGCNRNVQKYVCVRLKKNGSIVANRCTPSLGYIGYYSGVGRVSCVNGVNYSIEVMFFIQSSLYTTSSSATLHCDGYA